jgi:hypothetical protein
MALPLIAVLACGAYGGSDAVESAQPGQLDLARVTLFKNGFGFFVGQAALPADQDGMSFLLPVVPAQGTFWLSHPPDVNLVSVTAEKVKSEGQRLEAITIPEILKANVGKRVRITIEKKQVTGRIQGFTQDRRLPRILPYAAGVSDAAMDRPEVWPPIETGLLLLDVSSGTLTLDPQTIQHVAFPDGDVQRHFARTIDAVAIHVRTEAPARQQALTASFLAKGIAWTPSYLVDIRGQGKALLSAKALIVNEACDLNDVEVQLATGFPRLQFVDVRSPIGMKEPLDQFLAAMGAGEQDQFQVRPKAYAMAATARMGFARGATDVAPDYGAAQAGATAEDLFLYPAGRISLPRDQVAYIPLFTEPVPYEDLYECNIPDTVDEAGQFLFRGDQPDGNREQEVWHSLRLENTTQAPWTPAAAEAIRENMIVGQAQMPYTAAGDKATLRISRSADVSVEQEESEVERKQGVRQLYEVYYDLVTVKGEVALTNFKKQAVAVEVKKTLSGEVVSTDPQAKVEKLAAGIQKINGLRRLTWTIELPPGQTQKATYTYEVYVRGERAPQPAPSPRGAVPEPGAP